MTDDRKLPTIAPINNVVVPAEQTNSLVSRGLEAVRNRSSQVTSLSSAAELERLYHEACDREDYETALGIIHVLENRGSPLAEELQYDLLLAAEPRDIFFGADEAKYEAEAEHDSDRIVKCLRNLAEGGDALAQDILGTFYSGSASRASDDAEAVKWYRRAAEQGRPGAQTQLGVMYYVGKGVPNNYAEAIKWLQKAAEENPSGVSTAQFYLGNIFYYGEGVPQDFAEAMRWFRKAAEQSYDVALMIDAQFRLCEMYYKGEGGISDYVQSYMWLTIILKRSRFDIKATALINEISAKMSREQIAEAQTRAKEWIEVHAP